MITKDQRRPAPGRRLWDNPRPATPPRTLPWRRHATAAARTVCAAPCA